MWFGWDPKSRKELKDALSRVETVETAFDTLKRQCKQLEIEWEDTLERVARAVGRLSARDRRSLKAEEPEAKPMDPELRFVLERRARASNGGQ